MNETLAIALGWAVAAIALFSFLGVSAWTSARQREREAYYRSEAIKKVAEMQGTVPEPLMEMLREALKPPSYPPSGSMGPVQARAFYQSETLKRVAELKSGADGVLSVMREEERRSARRGREATKLTGLILAAVGIALMVFLHAMIPEMPVYLSGLIPLLVAAAMLIYVLAFAPRD